MVSIRKREEIVKGGKLVRSVFIRRKEFSFIALYMIDNKGEEYRFIYWLDNRNYPNLRNEVTIIKNEINEEYMIHPYFNDAVPLSNNHRKKLLSRNDIRVEIVKKMLVGERDDW